MSGYSATISIPVHPRVCGEHSKAFLKNFANVGSSPRVRGTHRFSCHGVYHQRFIPACAGNTFLTHMGWRQATVHPRVCGEHLRPRPSVCSPTGSSPRVRGTPEINIRQNDLRRFIPACAGNTRGEALAELKIAVHPRVCGEHNIMQLASRLIDGSSPRVRGTQAHYQAQRIINRFIPACAGNTLSLFLCF